MFLLDTMVLSELEKPAPDPGLSDWMQTVEWLDLHLSVITVAELWSGIVQLPQSRRRRSLETMFHFLPDRFPGRILPVDYHAGIKYAEIQANGPLPVLDTLIAATAISRHLTLVTRNTSDMARTGATILDPWT